MLVVAGQDRAIQERLSAELADVEGRFGAELLSDLRCVNDLVMHVERYRGKMLRPMLVLVSGMAVAPALAGGGKTPARGDLTDGHRVVATVVEMVHMATLVHDDILDEAEVRRRGTTVNALNGNEAAVMLGDYMISHAYHLCSGLGQPAVSRMIADTTNTVCEGELLQLANRNNWDLDEATYFEIIRRKTASLTGGCCRLGAILHESAGDALGDTMYSYGEKVGIAFQVVDDLLDLVGEEKTVGKSLGRDLAKGKLTLPVIHHLATADPARRRHMLGLIKSIGAEANADSVNLASVAEVRAIVVASPSMDYARDWSGRLIEQAKTSLDVLPDSPARALLYDMADAVLSRKS
jgi:octaprenyl-diphosphate synthase